MFGVKCLLGLFPGCTQGYSPYCYKDMQLHASVCKYMTSPVNCNIPARIASGSCAKGQSRWPPLFHHDLTFEGISRFSELSPKCRHALLAHFFLKLRNHVGRLVCAEQSCCFQIVKSALRTSISGLVDLSQWPAAEC